MNESSSSFSRIVSYFALVVATSAENVSSLSVSMSVCHCSLIVTSIFQKYLAETMRFIVFPTASVDLASWLCYVAISFCSTLQQFFTISHIV